MKDEYIQVRCDKEQKEKIKLLAKAKGVTVSDFILTELLDLEVVYEDVFSEYPVGQGYKRRYVAKKKILRPKKKKGDGVKYETPDLFPALKKKGK